MPFVWGCIRHTWNNEFLSSLLQAGPGHRGGTLGLPHSRRSLVLGEGMEITHNTHCTFHLLMCWTPIFGIRKWLYYSTDLKSWNVVRESSFSPSSITWTDTRLFIHIFPAVWVNTIFISHSDFLVLSNLLQYPWNYCLWETRNNDKLFGIFYSFCIL